MSKPCAKHPANHIIVQELALLASLMYFSSASPLAGPAKNNLFAAAERLSASDISFAELSTFNTVPARLQLEPFPRSVAMNRHRSTVHWFKVLQQRHKMRTFTPPVNPGRAVALYAPFRIPPHVPKVAHDPIRYEECGAHLEILRRSLEDYGMQVSLSGMTRRGCPVGKVAEYMVSLTQRATEEVEADGGERKEAHPIRQTDQLVSYLSAEQDHLSLSAYSLEEVPSTTVFAAKDTVSASMMFRIQRAVDGLIRSGFVGAGRLPTTSQLQDRAGVTLWVRHDPSRPQEIPPHHNSSIDTLRLHKIVLHFSPWECFHVRRFFYTGPPPFVTFMTLKALEMGFELGLNGLFRVHKKEDNTVVHKRVLIKSETDIFTILEVPYVDPIYRAIFCQDKGLL